MLDRFSKTDDFYINCFVYFFIFYFYIYHVWFSDFILSRRIIEWHVEGTWTAILKNDSLHRLLGRVINETLRDLLVFPTYEERFASFSVDVRYPRRWIERLRVPHCRGSPALDSITDLGIKSTAGWCRHSQYGSSRCGFVIARTRIDICPDDYAIWWSACDHRFTGGTTAATASAFHEIRGSYPGSSLSRKWFQSICSI